MPGPNRTTLTLSAALYGFVAFGAILMVAMASFFLLERLSSFQDEALEQAVHVRTRGAALSYARALDQDWQQLQAIAARVGAADLPSLETALSMTAGSGERISWAGYADLQGEVLAASNGLLVGQDVSQRPWFGRGLEGPFAGDVHDAVLLNKLLGGTEEDPIRFLDLSVPVASQNGQVQGVLGFHINSDWAQHFLAETAESLGLDLFLVNSSGQVVLSTDGLEGAPMNLQVFRAAAAGVQTSNVETWPDGRQYFTTVVPQVVHGDLPSFGWRLVGRIRPDAFVTEGANLARTAALMLAVGGGLLLLLSVAFVRAFVAPVRALARNAQRIADGHDDYPMELSRTAELATLSAALARLQGLRDTSTVVSFPTSRTGAAARPRTSVSASG